MKNKLHLLTICFGLSATMCWSQVPSIQWQKCLGGSYSENDANIIQTSDGGYVFVGATFSYDGDVSGNHGSSDIWVVKLTNNGTIEWQKCLGGDNDDSYSNIIQTSDGGYIIAGSTTSNDGDVSGNHGSSDIWVVKLTNNGTIQWQKCLGGSNWDDNPNISQTSDGGYILSGNTSSFNGDVIGLHNSYDIWVVKLTNNGTIQWQKCLGGSNVETTNSKISQTSDGGYILAGGTSSSDGDVSGYYGDTDIWVVKLSNNGTIQWQKCLGASNFETTNSNISQTSDGGYILAGITFSNIWNNGDVIGHHGGGDIWVVKLNNTGAIQWQKCLGGIDSEGFESDISQTSDGGYIVAGSTSSSDGDVSGNHPFGDFWVVKLSNTGTIQWQKYLGGSEGEYQTTKISQTSDGGFIFAGVTTSNDGDVSGNHGGEDIWVVKLSPEVLSSTSFLENSISIYPNPVLSILNINTDYQLINQHYTIIDGLGRVVLNGKLNEVESTINVEQLSKGIYYLKLSDKRARKFIKE